MPHAPDPPPAEATPDRIGPYRIVEVLGEGGMGTVYLAEQTEPVKRRVALKLIKLGMDSKAVLARFEQERQALALMQHDGIAKVHDCGTTERGQPYFVMEYVKGVPLNAYCDRQRIPLKQRIELMQQVCAAITHAHQKGVVHRDLKPGNVLVTEDEGRVQVKIIDFGLAKAMGQKLVEATLFTEVGQVVGTPEYMAPEQADPTNQDIDTRADVYSLGVMLYELLVGSLPFPQRELREAGLLEVQRILREVEPPKPSTRLSSSVDVASEVAQARRIAVGTLQKALRTDLDWVALKALEKDRARRYDTANALAADLQRYLDHEPLVAGPPSAGYRVKKLLRRYRGQVLAGTAVVLTAVVGAVVAVNYAVVADRRADENAKLAKEKGDLAETNGALAREKTALAAAEQEAKEDALARKSEFDQLAGVVLYDRAIANEKDLYPPWPHQIEALETWLREDCGKLLGKREEIERTVKELRRRALPQTEVEERSDLEGHPRYAEWQVSAKRLASLRRAQATRDGEPLVAVELTEAQQALDAKALNSLAWERVAPKAADRKTYGEEALGLACARLAVSKATDADRYQYLDTLAWALVANGQDLEAKQRSAEALAAAPAEQKTAYEGYQRDVEQALDDPANALAALETQHAALDAEVHARQTWTFAEEAPRFLHDTLSELLDKLASLEANEKAAVEQRLRWAEQVGDLTRAHPNARVTWGAVREGIAASEPYRGQTIPLHDEDVVGLVPLGANPVTGLYEFYELRSAWDGTSDPAAIAIPTHRDDGSIAVTGDTGIVFVLLPGGTFTMGAQKADPKAPNYDPQARSNETPHDVTLAPFFLARHELTKGQWKRLSGGGEPSWYRIGLTYSGGDPISYAHSVEQVDWASSERLLRQHGLTLPTEAQWEYGCRAGTTTPWFPGASASDLAGFANVLDLTGVRAVAAWGRQEGDFDDGRVSLGPAGAYRPNAFGLHDVHGNVWEWCLDPHGEYSGAVRAGDGLRLQGDGSGSRVNRGGSFMNPASIARSANGSPYAPTFRHSSLGLRPARASRLRD